MTAVVPATLLTVAVLVLGLSPVEEQPLPPLAAADKIQHLVAFCIVGYSYARATDHLLPLQRLRSRRLIAACFAVSLGGLLEILQGLTTYRSAELLDLVADALGVAGAMIGLHFFDRGRDKPVGD